MAAAIGRGGDRRSGRPIAGHLQAAEGEGKAPHWRGNRGLFTPVLCLHMLSTQPCRALPARSLADVQAEAMAKVGVGMHEAWGEAPSYRRRALAQF